MTYENIWPESLQEFIARHQEKEYLIVDVRQPMEYAKEHLPGSQLISLGYLEGRFAEIPKDKVIIFCCSNGIRSRVAAHFYAKSLSEPQLVYNLMGGIEAWQGKLLQNVPKVSIFKEGKETADAMLTAMDLEKGAKLFYLSVLEKFPEAAAFVEAEHLAEQEKEHARIIYAVWRQEQADPPPFEALWQKLDGNLIEGGIDFARIRTQLKHLSGDIRVELAYVALDLEYAAYDLYRAMANQIAAPSAREAFLALAQAEKKHMEILLEVLNRFPPTASGVPAPARSAK